MTYNNTYEVLSQYINYLNIPIAENDLRSAIENHTEKNTYSALASVLKTLNIVSNTFFVEASQVDKLSTPFITYLPFNSGQFVFVESSVDQYLNITHNRHAPQSLPIDKFKELFSGTILVIEGGKHTHLKPGFKKASISETNAALTDEQISKPSFLIIGAQKTGTTSFYDYLNFHPNFKPSSKKEIHFFDLNYSKGVDWYHAHFPAQLNKTQFTGEATPYYQFHPLVPERVFNYSPDIKLVSLLRDPIERAYSQYQMNICKGFENLSFEEAIDMETNRIEAEFQKIVTLKDYNSFNYQKYSYLSRGMYSKQLLLWFKFFRKEQFFFINSKELLNNPTKVLKDFCAFIGVPDFTPPHIITSNSNKYESMSSATKIKLKKFFQPYNEELNKLIGINLNN